MGHLYVTSMWLLLTIRRVFSPRRVRAAARSMSVTHGQGLVEYSLILVLLALVVIGTLSSVGSSTNDVFGQVSCSMAGKTWHNDNGQGKSNRCR